MKSKKMLLSISWSLPILMVLTICTTQADPVVKRDRQVSDFTGIEVGGAFNVILKQGSTHHLVVEAQEDLHDKITTEVRGEVLHIELEGNWKGRNHQKITIWVDFVDLNYLKISGAADIMAEGPVKAGNLQLLISGAGEAEFELKAETLEVDVSGAADLDLRGTVISQNITTSGASDYHAGELKCDQVKAKASGAGSITVQASQEIEAQASGAGSIKYYGKPDIQKTSSSGAGSVKGL